MIRYVKQEMPDIAGNGVDRCYYRIRSKGFMSTEELVERIAHPGSGLSKGSVMHVLQSLSDELSRSIAQGYSVRLHDIGLFKATIGLTANKDMDSLDEDEEQRNAASLRISGMRFRANKYFIEKTNARCRLKKGGIQRLHHSPFTKEERLRLALDYLSDIAHPFMRLDDYVKMTHVSRSIASLELRAFTSDPDSGLDFTGNGNCKVFIKRSSASG